MVISKFTTTGDLVASRLIGGSEHELALGADVDPAGNVVIVGLSCSPDFPQVNPLQEAYGGGDDCVVLRVSPATLEPIFSSFLGGSGAESCRGVDTDAGGGIYVVGLTTSADFPVTKGAFQAGLMGQRDAIVVKVSPDDSLEYSSYFGGGGTDSGRDILVLGPNQVLTGGVTDSIDLPLVGPIQKINPGHTIYLAALDISANHLFFSSYVGGGDESGPSLDLIPTGEVVMALRTFKDSLPTVAPLQPTRSGDYDAFFAKISGLNPPDNDLDTDGVDNSIEDAAPNGGDGNNDGTADSEQAHVASLPSAVTGEYVSLISAQGTSLVSVKAVENPSPMDLPPGVVFPLGLFEFSVQGLAPGSATTVELLLPDGLAIDSYYKFGPTPSNGTDHWYDFAWDDLTGVEIFEGKLDLHFIDGSRGDDDLAANGTVIEPGGPAQILDSFFFPQFADGSIANIQLLSTLVLANAGADSAVQVEFFSSPDGEPMELTLGDLGSDSHFELDLKEGESISLQTPGTGDLQVGYARVFAEPDVGGVVVFARRDVANDITLVEAGVPASNQLTEFSVVVDSLEDRDTGLALVYPAEEGSPDANVTVRLYDQEFNLIGERTLDPLVPGSHFSKFVFELFADPDVIAQAQEMEGLLTVESDQPLVAVTLRQNDAPGEDFPDEVPTLTTFPVIPGRPGQ